MDIYDHVYLLSIFSLIVTKEKSIWDSRMESSIFNQLGGKQKEG